VELGTLVDELRSETDRLRSEAAALRAELQQSTDARAERDAALRQRDEIWAAVPGDGRRDRTGCGEPCGGADRPPGQRWASVVPPFQDVPTWR
jgi:hypothetical protein